MATFQKKSLDTPEETRRLPKTVVDVVNLGDYAAMKTTFEPGWRWSECVKPQAGTESCQTQHFGYVMSGRMHIRMDDGTEDEVGPGDVVLIMPGHDAWVVGDEPYVGLDFQGAKLYAK